MMHSFVKSLLEKYNIPTSDRSCYLSVLWNGKDLALNTCHELSDGSSVVMPLSDFDLLHEIAHWLVATPTEREFPEFGLPTAYIHGASRYDWSLLKGKERAIALQADNGVLTKEESDFREYCADFIGCMWASNIMKVPNNFWPHVKYTDDRRTLVAQALAHVVRYHGFNVAHEGRSATLANLGIY